MSGAGYESTTSTTSNGRGGRKLSPFYGKMKEDKSEPVKHILG